MNRRRNSIMHYLFGIAILIGLLWLTACTQTQSPVIVSPTQVATPSQAQATPTPSQAATPGTATPTKATTGSTTPSTGSDVLLEYSRTGGFAGMNDHVIIYTNGKAVYTGRNKTPVEFTVDQSTLNQLTDLLAKAQFTQLANEYLPKGTVNDAFTYVITYKGHSVRTQDTATPEILQPVITALDKLIQANSK